MLFVGKSLQTVRKLPNFLHILWSLSGPPCHSDCCLSGCPQSGPKNQGIAGFSGYGLHTGSGLFSLGPLVFYFPCCRLKVLPHLCDYFQTLSEGSLFRLIGTEKCLPDSLLDVLEFGF